MRAALIFNPISGRGKPKEKLLEDVLARLRDVGLEVWPQPTEGPGHGIAMAREATKRGFKMAIAWGGDGTLNEVATGLLDSDTIMGVLPGGTVNVFARETGIPLRLPGAIELLGRGKPMTIPVGMAADRAFLSMAGFGLDGEVVYRLKASLKDALGTYAFWVDGIRMLTQYPMTPLTARTNGKAFEGTGLVAGKIRRYGPSYVITPDARLEEPLLDVVIFRGSRPSDYVRYVLGIVGRFHTHYPDVEHLKTNELFIECEGRVPYQLDGEPAGFAPVTLGVRADALSVVLPNGTRYKSNGR